MNESQIFTNALKLGTPSERAAYLDEACAGDAQLRAAVEDLLRAQASDPEFLERPAASLTGTVDAPAAPERPTATAGPAPERPGLIAHPSGLVFERQVRCVAHAVQGTLGVGFERGD